jgi:hypothetical protein
MGIKDSKQSQSTASDASPPAPSLSPSPLANEALAATKYVLSYFGGITTDEQGAPPTAEAIAFLWRGFIYSKKQDNTNASPPGGGGAGWGWGGGVIVEALRHEQKNGHFGCIYKDVLFRPQKQYRNQNETNERPAQVSRQRYRAAL